MAASRNSSTMKAEAKGDRCCSRPSRSVIVAGVCRRYRSIAGRVIRPVSFRSVCALLQDFDPTIALIRYSHMGSQ